MVEPVRVAIQKALTDRAIAFAAAQAPPITISLPNVAFTPPAPKSTTTPVKYGVYLQLTFLPAKNYAPGVSYDSTVQHHGVLQVSVFYGAGAGEYAPARIAELVAARFARGTEVTLDGFTTVVDDVPDVGQAMLSDGWFMVPVSIPYKCFATPA